MHASAAARVLCCIASKAQHLHGTGAQGEGRLLQSCHISSASVSCKGNARASRIAQAQNW